MQKNGNLLSRERKMVSRPREKSEDKGRNAKLFAAAKAKKPREGG